MSTGLTNTHTARGFSDLYQVFARKQCILCPALRHGCLTLLYVISIRDFFSAPETIAHGSIRLPPRSLASSRGCSLAIITVKKCNYLKVSYISARINLAVSFTKCYTGIVIQHMYSLHLGKFMFSFKNDSIPSSFSRSILRTN